MRFIPALRTALSRLLPRLPGAFSIALLTMFVVTLTGAALPATRSVAQTDAPDITALITPDELADRVALLAEEIGTRTAGSAEEKAAADLIAAEFEAMGYDVVQQTFPLENDRTSQNVIATRPGEGPAIIIGAHYDCVAAGTGADDNASGVAVVLTVADLLQEVETTAPLTFVAFGSEEIGLVGSTFFAESLGDDLADNVMLMLNIDTVGIGDDFNVYAGAQTESESYTDPYTPGPTWARDLALELGDSLGLEVKTTPAESWNGFTGPWSDHVPFVNAGVPIIYFERWNWTAGDDLGWGQETAERDYLHTPDDQFGNIDPTKIEPVAETAAAVVIALATGTAAPPAP